MTSVTTFAEGRDLLLTCVIDAPPSAVYRAWTDPALVTQWFTPPPYTTPSAVLDVRPGGTNTVTMRGPDGHEFPSSGVYLEVIPNQRLVFTDAFTSAWEPAAKPFMTVILTFEEQASGTLYTARVRHWSVEDREAHEAMGFHQGWPIATQQLAALVEKAV